MIGTIWTLIGAILLGFYNGLLLLDDKISESDPRNSKIEDEWHATGTAIFIYLAVTSGIFYGWEYIPFTLACFWSIFAGIVHKIGLDRPFFFVGTTAKTDKLLRKIAPKKPELVSTILKLGLLTGSIILIFFIRK